MGGVTSGLTTGVTVGAVNPIAGIAVGALSTLGGLFGASSAKKEAERQNTQSGRGIPPRIHPTSKREDAENDRPPSCPPCALVQELHFPEQLLQVAADTDERAPCIHSSVRTAWH